MKILNTSSFVLERVKVKPVTNAEWDKLKMSMLHELPLEYENVIVPGNVVTLRKFEDDSIRDWIVLSRDKCGLPLDQRFLDKLFLMRYGEDLSKKYTYMFGWFHFAEREFPWTPWDKVIKIKGTLSDSEIYGVKNENDVKSIYDKYNLLYYKE